MNDENLKPARKGEKRSPGRPKDPPELSLIKKLTKGELELLMNRLLVLSKAELKSVHENGTAIEMSMASIILKSIDHGDHFRLQFFIERLLGKVTDKLEVEDKSGLAEKLNRFKSKKND